MHGNTFHSLWVLQLENNALISGDDYDYDDVDGNEELNEDNDREQYEDQSQSSRQESSVSSSESDTFLIAINRNNKNGVICSPYQINQDTPKSQRSSNNNDNNNNNNNNNHIRAKRPKPKGYILSNLHLILLLITSSINALMVKVFCVFSGFIYNYYDIPFQTLTLILGLGALSTTAAVFINPYILFLRCNMLVFVVQSMQIIGLMIILTFEHYVLLTIGIILLFNTYQIHWGVANTMISCFIQPVNNKRLSKVRHAAVTKKRYLTVFNTQWAISTLYFFIVGVISESSSFFGFLSFVMAIAIVLAIMNCVMLPKQPALPAQLHHNHEIYAHVDIYNLSPSSLGQDVNILCSNRRFVLVCLGFTFTFFIWGWFYVTFGPFLQSLYNLDTIKFGAYTAIIEAVGNGIAMISYIYFGSIFISKSTKKIKTPSNYIETEILLFISSLILVISFLCICLITHIPNKLLSNEIIVGIIIILYFIGHEGCIIGLMILHVEVTPILQQPRASGIVSMINCISVFFSQSIIQSIIIGQMNLKYFKPESIILCIISIVLLSIIITLTIIVHKSRNNKIIINNNISSSQTTTTTITTNNNNELINLPYNHYIHHHSINTPILREKNYLNNGGKSYTYHTLNPIQNSGSTDLILNVNDHYNNYKL